MPAPHRERSNRKSEIIRAFAEMVAERGYDNVSLRDVAEALDMSKGTILHHFTSKDRLLERVHSDYMKRRLAEAHALLAQLDSPLDQLAGMICQLMLAEAHDRASTVAFGREIVRFASEEIMSDVRRMRDEYSGLLRDVVQRGMDDGFFVAEDAGIVTLQIFGMCNWSWTWYRPEGAWSAEDIAATFTRVISRGLVRESASYELSDEVVAIVRTTMTELGGTPIPASAAG